MDEPIPENKFRKPEDDINNSEKWKNMTDPSLITGEGCFDLNCDFSQQVSGDSTNIMGLIGAFMRMMPPTYSSGYTTGS